MQCPRCQQENPTSHKCCRECGTPLAHLEAGAQPAPSYTDLQRFLTEARDQQAATSEILRVISRSPTNLQPVLDAIATNAALVCDAYDAVVFLREGDRVRPAAHYGPINITLQHSILSRDSVTEVAILDREPVHVHDLLATEPSAFPRTTKAARQGGYRTALSVPLLGENEAIGALAIRRREIQPFTTQQIELLQTFAAQAVIAIENARLFTEAQAKNLAVTQAHAQVTEALEQQTATSEILRVISSSPTDVRPVFDAIVLNASRLCGGEYAIVIRYDGEMMHLAAQHNPRPGAAEPVARLFPRTPTRGSSPGRAILDRSLAHIPDVLADPEYDPDIVKAAGLRGVLSVPMFRDGKVIGAISISRDNPGAFAPNQIELLQTFADQAVIAIENVRLFKELEVRNNELSEALDQQTATSEILRVISSSPNDVQPVFGSIATTALRLCDATLCTVFRFDGDFIHLVAHHQVSTHGASAYRDAYPARPGRGGGTHRAILTGSTVHIRDIREDPEYELHALARANDFGCVLSVPMLRDGVPIGAITVGRAAGRAFSDAQIQLLKTFADQAVIAIQNVRLFTELQTSNRELTTALDTQTATSDILRVISLSQTDVQPVFDAIVTSAVKLLRGSVAAMSRIAGDGLELAAFTNSDAAGDAAVRSAFPQLLDSDWPHSRVVRDRIVLNVADARSDPQLPKAIRNVAVARGYQSLLVLPILRHDDAVGAISVTRREPGGFTDDEIALLKTFADQAVIAIENVRLFKELEARTADLTRSVEQLTALGEVGRAVSSTLDLQTVLTTIVSRAIQLSGLDGGVVHEYDEGTEEFVHRAQAETGGALAAVRRAERIPRGQGVIGRTAITLEPVQVPDITVPGAYVGPQRENLIESGIRALLAVPMVREGRIIGCLGVTRNRPGEFPAETIELLRTFATQSALAIQNARLFQEIADKSRQLEAASQHKSEFLANMSHELRTPLNAVIGFSEVLLQRMFGELNAKQDEYLNDIYASGQHLLSLINDILDLSKIEAGRMELAPAPFHLPTALESAVTLVKERAARHGITLELDLDPRLGELVGDERKVKQVLLNLLSNAVKFTPEGGRISLRAGRRDGAVAISVTDTGIGIAPEDQAAIFEEFRQVGNDETRKQEGTGLGLTLAKKFVELHDGRMWVESELGLGSTFTFTLPVS
jgi:GAF domain-containing protein